MRASMLNILNVWRQATLEERAAGRQWYDQANALADELVTNYGYRSVGGGQDESPADARVRAAAVIAVLSPRLSWDKNVEAARRAYGEYLNRLQGLDLHGPTADGFVAAMPVLNTNAAKAFKLLSGADPDEIVGGPKVRAFWFGIVDPSDPRVVCVDRHAFDIAVGGVMDDATRGKVLGRKGAYDRFAQAYRRAAARLSDGQGYEWNPAQVQAVTWVTWRRLKKEGKV
jgi:hypothetical protein